MILSGTHLETFTRCFKERCDDLELPRSQRVDWAYLTISFDYNLLTPLQRRFTDFEAEELAIKYADNVSLELRLPQERLAAFEKMFADLTAGQGQAEHT
jgi:putative IMPACT (imprinted ancient) family translation regulator